MSDWLVKKLECKNYCCAAAPGQRITTGHVPDLVMLLDDVSVWLQLLDEGCQRFARLQVAGAVCALALGSRLHIPSVTWHKYPAQPVSNWIKRRGCLRTPAPCTSCLAPKCWIAVRSSDSASDGSITRWQHQYALWRRAWTWSRDGLRGPQHPPSVWGPVFSTNIWASSCPVSVSC